MYFGAVGGPDFVFPERPDKVNGDAEIYNSMKTTTYHMLLFLNYIQKKVDAINSEFQSKSFRLHRLYTTNCGECQNILGMLFKNDLLSSKALSTVNPSHPNFSKTYRNSSWSRYEAVLVKETMENNEKKSDC